MKTIEKSIDLDTSKENIWRVLTEKQFISEWYQAFGPMVAPETDWAEGSQVKFLDHDGNGITGEITTNKEFEQLTTTYDGIVSNGIPDYDSDNAKMFKGAKESYYLSDHNGMTRLRIESDMDEEYYDDMATNWEAALQHIAELATAMNAIKPIPENRENPQF